MLEITCPICDGELKLMCTHCQSSLKKQILENISFDAIEYIALYFFSAGFEAGRLQEFIEIKKNEIVNELVVKFVKLVKTLPEEIK